MITKMKNKFNLNSNETRTIYNVNRALNDVYDGEMSYAEFGRYMEKQTGCLLSILHCATDYPEQDFTSFAEEDD